MIDFTDDPDDAYDDEPRRDKGSPMPVGNQQRRKSAGRKTWQSKQATRRIGKARHGIRLRRKRRVE
jgi:hypothetical protein